MFQSMVGGMMISFGALLACAGIQVVQASSSPPSQGDGLHSLPGLGWSYDSSSTHSERPWRSLVESRLLSDECSMMDEEEDLMDLSIVSTADPVGSRTLTDRHRNHFQMRLPQSFQDPVAEHPLGQRFGPEVKPKLLKTGTTIAGVCGYDRDGRPFVVLGADTRATAGRMVADKRCSKIHCLARNIWCCGAGTSADLDHITRKCRYSLALRHLVEHETVGNQPRRWPPDQEEGADSVPERPAHHSASMDATCRFFRNSLFQEAGAVAANLIVGGVDQGSGRPHIRAIHPHGSMDVLPYAALGSGGLAAMAVIESRYHANITLEEGMQIVKSAILSGIQNDLGSGSQVDLCVITTTGEDLQVVSSYTRAVVPEQEFPKVDETTFTDGMSTEERPPGASTPGVNGFGNVPFSIRSQRVVIQSRQAEEDSRSKKWEQALITDIN